MNIKMPEGITLEQLQSNWNIAYSAYGTAFKRMRLLDITDRGRLWEAVNTKYPSYQILPNTNHVSYIKNNLLASIYTVAKSAQLVPTTEDDIEPVTNINILMDHLWAKSNIGYHQMLAGERAALTNVGITQVGWDNTLSGGNNDFSYQGAPVLKNVDPSKFMRDPHAPTLDDAAYCMTWDSFHKNVLKSNKLYEETLDNCIAKANASAQPPLDLVYDRGTTSQSLSNRDYFTVITHWVRIGNSYHEIHLLNNEAILAVKEDIKPSAFPFAMLYCNLPSGDVVGTSEPAKVFANSFAYNLSNSMFLTGEYKNQRPPKYVNAQSGINLATFVQHANDPDYTFVTNQDASRAVHYHQFPSPSPALPTILGTLDRDIAKITGVDDRYTGKDTGSILTTGGMELAIGQATLIDQPKIRNYEAYTMQLSKLFLGNLIEFGTKRKYLLPEANSNRYTSVEVDFPTIRKKEVVFAYEMDISSELPKNKTRIAQTANILMEKQLQYSSAGEKVDLITPEEWLSYQDLPHRELMQERMNIQRSAEYTEKVSKILYTFAGLTSSGVTPEDALALTAQRMQADEIPGTPPPEDMLIPELDTQGQEPYTTNIDNSAQASNPFAPPANNFYEEEGQGSNYYA